MYAYKRIIATVVLLGINSLIFAQQENGYNQPDAVSSPSNVGQDKKQKMAFPGLGDKLPPYNNPNRMMVNASFIYWQAIADGLDYGINEDNTTTFTGTFNNFGFTGSNKISEKQMKFKWDPGFKVGIGVIFGKHDQWDVLLNWTWLHSSASVNDGTGVVPDLSTLTQGQSSSSTVEVEFAVPNWSSTLLGTPAILENADWTLRYNTIDLEFGRNFFLRKNLTFRPHMGLRGALIHQKTTTDYTIGSTGAYVMPVVVSQTPVAGNSTGTSQFDGKTNFNGVGLRGGFDIRLNFTRDFGVYGSLATAILWGRFQLKESFDISATVTPRGGLPMLITNSAGLKSHFDRIRTNLQAAMGFMWHTSFNKDKQHVAIKLGYEFNEWFQLNELRAFQGGQLNLMSNRVPGDLGLQGLTFDCEFDF